MNNDRIRVKIIDENRMEHFDFLVRSVVSNFSTNFDLILFELSLCFTTYYVIEV